MTPAEHRTHAENLLAEATEKGLTKEWSVGLLAAAQVHATLATVGE